MGSARSATGSRASRRFYVSLHDPTERLRKRRSLPI
jgi:hypothetical protein